MTIEAHYYYGIELESNKEEVNLLLNIDKVDRWELLDDDLITGDDCFYNTTRELYNKYLTIEKTDKDYDRCMSDTADSLSDNIMYKWDIGKNKYTLMGIDELDYNVPLTDLGFNKHLTIFAKKVKTIDVETTNSVDEEFLFNDKEMGLGVKKNMNIGIDFSEFNNDLKMISDKKPKLFLLYQDV